MLRKIFKSLSAPFRPSPLSLKAVMARCRSRISHVGTLLDVGASNGCWSVQARKYFPEMACFMIEAQAEHAVALEKLKASSPAFDFISAAAGDHDGTVYFQEGDLFGGVATHSPHGAGYRQVPMIAIDTLVEQRGLKAPFMLKLDTHGFEVSILEGARKMLLQTALVVVEVYNFKLTMNSLRFHEMCEYLENSGFRCVDICNPVFRKDGVLWQMDMYFAPASASEFTSNSYNESAP